MFRTLFLALTMLVSSSVLAFPKEFENCDAARAADSLVEEAAKQLVRDYPGTLAFYGFSAFMLNEANPQKLEEYIVGIGLAFVGCSIMIDTKSCDFVAGRLVTLFTTRAAICVADRNYHCGICR